MIAIQLLYNYNDMEVITFESETFKALVSEIQETKKLMQIVFAKMNDATQDRWLDPKEAADYVGFKPAWIKARSAQIGAFQAGCGLRFKKSDVDAYMKKNSFKAK